MPELDCEHPSGCVRRPGRSDYYDEDDEFVCGWCEDLARIKELEESIQVLRKAIRNRSFIVPENATLIVGDAEIGLVEVCGGTVQQGSGVGKEAPPSKNSGYLLGPSCVDVPVPVP